MTIPDRLRNIGDEVMVYDSKGNYELRGVIMGVYASNPPIYDVQPNRAESLSRRLCGIPESRLRSVGRPILAYERKSADPQHILYEA
jgi:hypothetical protein